ncbi:phosphatidate cytidylyltransferase [Caproiciproducens sp. MSJ-32]|uniref:phosphatidate cytidylyltransferase n=1 Tax=Caproiciproducens sp. MSJ-32 TaxID=2841527 RepID=UPI001C1073D3|nr:phosphatidate cytidylyltransferase [Caproiciproducens sp. MSJ-32]MBU5455778.1 phosphatidate cytidylyltransferase [Caproiciproducens sp. MSJ-32]
MKKNSRYFGALVMAPFIIFLFLGGVWLKYITFIISILGLYEIYNALKEKEFNPIAIAGYILLFIYYIMNNNIEKFVYVLLFVSIILLIIPVINLKYNFVDSALTILCFIYVGILFSFIPLITYKENGNYLIWLIFIGSWISDTLAYYCGKYFGRKKLCSEISPNKTIAGSIGGFLGSTIACGIFGIIMLNKIANINLIHFFLIGALCGIMGQFGDLAASSIKRYVGIKDYGNLIPGHGGILDRFDSILLNSFVVYYYLSFIIGV